MYRLIFTKNKSKYFDEALKYAQELGGSFDGKEVVLNIADENLTNAYSTMRMIFAYVQNWKSTKAYFNELEVEPYQFILWMHRIGECAEESEIDKFNCSKYRNTTAWSCKKIDLISYEIKGDGNYNQNNRYWYNFGEFKGEKWVIDKVLIRKKLLDFVNRKGIEVCPFYDENELLFAIDNLPDFIIPDGVVFKIHYQEKYAEGETIQIRSNIRHVTKKNFSRIKELTLGSAP